MTLLNSNIFHNSKKYINYSKRGIKTDNFLRILLYVFALLNSVYIYNSTSY